MAKFGENLAKLAQGYAAAADSIPSRLRAIQTQGAHIAIAVAAENTPPNDNSDLRGTGMITGTMKAAWAQDSQPEPVDTGRSLTSTLENKQEYSSFVNDGHRMDQHFVPGLMINPASGLLEKVDPARGGMMVGTKTAYIPGQHMVEKATKAYEEFVNKAVQDMVIRPLQEIGVNPDAMRTMTRRADQSFENVERHIGGSSPYYGRNITPENEAWIRGALPGQHPGEW